MKNIDKIRAMSAEELAKNVLMQNTCELCAFYNNTHPNRCGREDDCIKGFTEWLNQEDNPIPEIKEGDLVEDRKGNEPMNNERLKPNPCCGRCRYFKAVTGQGLYDDYDGNCHIDGIDVDATSYCEQFEPCIE